MPAPASNVRVAVRVRPFLQREIDRGAVTCFEMEGATTTLLKPTEGKDGRGGLSDSESKRFTFDYSYNSFLPRDDPRYASQETVWNDLGTSVLDSAWEGYNVSLFAYGQTGSGKSFSMMGYGEEKGIIPRAVTRIFERIAGNEDADLSYRVECSMLEIYNERIRDLFDAASRSGSAAQLRGGPAPLKIRDHPRTGPFVEGLRRFAVTTYEQVNALMDKGAEARTIAATNMNASSSRAHTIFSIVVTQVQQQNDEKIKRIAKATEKASVINLIDLAGSERADSTGATGDRLKEGAAINQSLSALGNVINALAKKSKERAAATSKKSKKKKEAAACLDGLYGAGGGDAKTETIVPYRNSVLTHLLKNSLGGNAKTIMIAAISPSAINYAETLSTLRYADRAKQIMNKAVINEDPNARMIRELKEEIQRLKGQGGTGGAAGSGMSEDQVKARIEAEKEAAIAEMRRAMEEQAAEMERMRAEQREGGGGGGAAADAPEGMEGMEAAWAAAEGVQSGLPCFVNLNEDPALSGVLKYHLPPGQAQVIGKKGPQMGSSSGSVVPEIVLGGLGIMPFHARAMHVVESDGGVPSVTLQLGDANAKVFVNGRRLEMGDGALRVRHDDRVLFGNNNVFRLHFPGLAGEGAETTSAVDWQFAMQELNSQALTALGGGQQSAEAIAKAKTEKEAMAAKLAEMEQKLLSAHAAAQAEMREQRAKWEAGADASKREAEESAMRARQDELERRLQEQIEETRLKEEERERRRLQRAVLDERLLKLLPHVQEANAIAEELGKHVFLAPKLITSSGGNTDVSVLVTFTRPKGAAEAAKGGEEDGAWADRRQEAADTEWLWAHDKFMDRLYLMRDMYQCFCEVPPDGAGGAPAVLAAMWARDRDPFWDPPSDALLGTARVELEALRYCMGVGEEAMEAWTPVVNYKGKQVGELQVSVMPSLVPAAGADPDASEGEEGEELEDYEEISDPALSGRRLALVVTVAGMRGIVTAHHRFPSVFAQFSFFGTDPTVTTVPIENDDDGRGAAADGGGGALRSNPVALATQALVPVGWAATVVRTISPALVRHFCTSALEVDVWGSYDAPTAAGTAVLGGGAGAGTGLGEECFGSGEAAAAAAGTAVGAVGAGVEAGVEAGQLTREQLLTENRKLRAQVATLQQELETWRPGAGGAVADGGRMRAKLESAQQMDAALQANDSDS